MFKKVIIVNLVILIAICISGCGMSDAEKHKDLEVKLYGFDLMVELGIENPYRAYCFDYHLNADMYEKSDTEKLDKKIKRAESALEDIQKFKKALKSDKIKLEKGNDIDKDNEFEKLKSQYEDLAQQLEDMTQLKIKFLKNHRDGRQQSLSPEELKKIRNLKETNTCFDENINNVNNAFSKIIRKYDIAGINRV